MKTHRNAMLLAVAFLGAASLPLNAGTADQEALRSQISRFWGVAETRIAETPVAPAVVEQPAPRNQSNRSTTYGYPTACSAASTHRAPAVEKPVVQARQQASSQADSGSFGLTLLGGLRIFDFTWSDNHSRSSDELQGNL